MLARAPAVQHTNPKPFHRRRIQEKRLRPERGAQPPRERERGWGPASSEKRLRPERGAQPPRERERGWGPASSE